MKKIVIAGLFFIGIFITSCTYSPVLPDTTPNASIYPQISPPWPDHSFRSCWEMVDQSVSNENGLSIVVYAMKISGLNTEIISSVEVSNVDEADQSSINIQMKDDKNVSKLLSKTNLVHSER
jgi:hypothetical protein